MLDTGTNLQTLTSNRCFTVLVLLRHKSFILGDINLPCNMICDMVPRLLKGIN